MSFINMPDIIDDTKGSVTIKGQRSSTDLVKFGNQLGDPNLMMELGSANSNNSMQFYSNGGGSGSTSGIIRCNDVVAGISFPISTSDRARLENIIGDNRIATMQDIAGIQTAIDNVFSSIGFGGSVSSTLSWGTGNNSTAGSGSCAGIIYSSGSANATGMLFMSFGWCNYGSAGSAPGGYTVQIPGFCYKTSPIFNQEYVTWFPDNTTFFASNGGSVYTSNGTLQVNAGNNHNLGAIGSVGQTYTKTANLDKLKANYNRQERATICKILKALYNFSFIEFKANGNILLDFYQPDGTIIIKKLINQNSWELEDYSTDKWLVPVARQPKKRWFGLY